MAGPFSSMAGNVPDSRWMHIFFLIFFYFSSSSGPTWLQDGYSRIFRSYVFGPSGFWTMALLSYPAKFDPFLSLDCIPTPSTLAQSKERKGSNFAILQPWAPPPSTFHRAFPPSFRAFSFRLSFVYISSSCRRHMFR